VLVLFHFFQDKIIIFQSVQLIFGQTLSESKLNALGFSISIANSIKGNSIFGFLLIDDPVQSMDVGHSAQIIDIVRSLAEEESKQIILLSHNLDWLKEVRKSCRSMNGRYYEIVSYTIEGPAIRRCLWAAIEERFMEVKSLLGKSGLSSLEKQRVAEEFRLLYNELASELCKAKTGKSSNADNLNIAIFRKLLIESDIPITDVDKAFAAYSSVSSAHHALSYDEPIEKLREYLKIAETLDSYLKLARADNKVAKAVNEAKK
jgi:predicted transcriptional regulator